MLTKDAKNYRCPKTAEPLTLKTTSQEGERVIEGVFTSPDGNEYPVKEGIPDFTYPFHLNDSDADARNYYDAKCDEYDAYLPLTFETFGVDETHIRNRMIDDLNLTPTATVLEIGAGSGRDSELILKRLSEGGKLYMQDISHGIFNKAVEKLRDVTPEPAFFVGNGSYLPFVDNYFDAVYHFGGLNTFADIKRAFQEAVRVTKTAGKIVMGDESMPAWLRDTEFGKILMNSNPHYTYPLPLEHLPIEARNTTVRWIIGEVFYVIDFEVGESTPPADFDFPIPGPRGGTHRTRYHGHIEGVSEIAKQKAYEALKHTDKNMHQWLSDVIIEAAETLKKNT